MIIYIHNSMMRIHFYSKHQNNTTIVFHQISRNIQSVESFELVDIVLWLSDNRSATCINAIWAHLYVS